MTIKELYIGLNEGRRYMLKSEFLAEAQHYAEGVHRFFAPWAQLYITEDAGGEYIGWRHYGSSANKNTLENLEWILKNIFKCEAADFVEVPEM